MAFRRSSLLIRKSFLTSTLSNCGFYFNLFQLSLASILFSIFLLCLRIVRKSAAFDFITCFSFCKEIIVAHWRRAELFHRSIKNVLKLTNDAKQLADITCFQLENVNTHGFFEILSPQSILLVSNFPHMKSFNELYFPTLQCDIRAQKLWLLPLFIRWDLGTNQFVCRENKFLATKTLKSLEADRP